MKIDFIPLEKPFSMHLTMRIANHSLGMMGILPCKEKQQRCTATTLQATFVRRLAFT
jgi:hypothetical protein